MVNLLPSFVFRCDLKTKAKPGALVSPSFYGGLCGSSSFKIFLCKSHRKEGPPVTGRLNKLRRYWMSQKTGKGDALRKEKGVFAYFCRRMDKSKASGSTQTADLKILFSRRHSQVYGLWRNGLASFTLE